MPRAIAPWLAALAALAVLLAAGLPALADGGDDDAGEGRGHGERGHDRDHDREQEGEEDEEDERDLERHGVLGLPLLGKKPKPPKEPRSFEPQPMPEPAQPEPFLPLFPAEPAPVPGPDPLGPTPTPSDPGAALTDLPAAGTQPEPGAPLTSAGSVVREVLRHILMVGGVAMLVGLVMLVAERRRR